MKDLDEAARKTAEYLYSIDGEVTPEVVQAINTLRQLINEEFVAKDKMVSSQLLYDMINPLISATVVEELEIANKWALTSNLNDASKHKWYAHYSARIAKWRGKQ